jgi:DNA-binding MarR family transcriptional regulator
MSRGDTIVPLVGVPQFGRAEIVATALAMLDDKGIERLSLRRIAEQLGTDATMLRRHFTRRRDLLDAMAVSMMRTTEKPLAANATWQDSLRHRAGTTRHAMLSRRDGALVMARGVSGQRANDRACTVSLTAAGFAEDAAEAALELVDRFTLGWTVNEQAGGPSACDADSRFGKRLDIILRALEPAAPPAPIVIEEAREPQPHFLQLRFWNVLHTAKESAEIAYSRTMQLIELDRRILLLLQSHGALVPADVSASMGVDKAQVSRAVRRLEEMVLIGRDGVRSPLALTTKGRMLTERMMRLAELRNRELTFGISDQQLIEFFAVLEELMARAVQLLEQERKLAAMERAETSLGYDDVEAEGEPENGRIVVERSRILPPMNTFSSYTLRSAALVFKRLTGLSNFESWVLNEIARHPPMEWSNLVQTINRDQSQAGRTVRRLIEMGLVVRTGAQARRHGTFYPTAEGARLHALLEHAGHQRSEFLVQNLSEGQLQNFLGIFEIIAHNAEAQLSRERALDEVERAK